MRCLLAVHIRKNDDGLLVPSGNEHMEPGSNASICDVRELIRHPGHVLGSVVLLENRGIAYAPIVLILLLVARRERETGDGERCHDGVLLELVHFLVAFAFGVLVVVGLMVNVLPEGLVDWFGTTTTVVW